VDELTVEEIFEETAAINAVKMTKIKDVRRQKTTSRNSGKTKP